MRKILTWTISDDAFTTFAKVIWLHALRDNACTKTGCTSRAPSPSVTNVRNMLESWHNRTKEV